MKKNLVFAFGLSLLITNSYAQASSISNADVKREVIRIGYQPNDVILEGATLTNLKDGGALYIGEQVYKFNAKTNTWSKIKPLNIPRSGHKSLLLDDGRVFVVGGYKKIGDGLRPQYEYVYQPEIYTPSSDSWKILPPSTRIYKWGNLIQSSNKVLVFGSSGNDYNCDNAGTFNLSTNSWVEQTGPGTYCYVAAMQVYKLRSGNIMILSEVNSFHVSIYNPSTGEFQLAPSPQGNNGLSGQRADGSVFIGVNAGGATWHQNDEMKLLVWDEGQSKWNAVANMNTAREGRNYRMAGAFGLPDGRYVFYGYRQSYGFDGDIYNPVSNSWSTFGDGGFGGNSWPLDIQMTLLPGSKKILMMQSGADSADLFTFP